LPLRELFYRHEGGNRFTMVFNDVALALTGYLLQKLPELPTRLEGTDGSWHGNISPGAVVLMG
jgi:hypothetical protein